MIDPETKQEIISLVKTALPKFFDFYKGHFDGANPFPDRSFITEQNGFRLSKPVNILMPDSGKIINIMVSIDIGVQ
jgi:hypothetical protein